MKGNFLVCGTHVKRELMKSERNFDAFFLKDPKPNLSPKMEGDEIIPPAFQQKKKNK